MRSGLAERTVLGAAAVRKHEGMEKERWPGWSILRIPTIMTLGLE